MPLRDLLNAIEAEANEEVARLGRESEEEAETILAAARAEAARVRAEILRARAPAAQEEARRRLALAHLEASRLERDAREEAFEGLLAETRALLAVAREKPGYPDALRALLEEALAALPDATTARVNPRDGTLAEELLRETGADLRVAPDPGVGGGAGLESAGGRTVRNTLEERLANAVPSLRPWYGERLAGLEAPVGASR